MKNILLLLLFKSITSQSNYFIDNDWLLQELQPFVPNGLCTENAPVADNSFQMKSILEGGYPRYFMKYTCENGNTNVKKEFFTDNKCSQIATDKGNKQSTTYTQSTAAGKLYSYQCNQQNSYAIIDYFAYIDGQQPSDGISSACIVGTTNQLVGKVPYSLNTCVDVSQNVTTPLSTKVTCDGNSANVTLVVGSNTCQGSPFPQETKILSETCSIWLPNHKTVVGTFPITLQVYAVLNTCVVNNVFLTPTNVPTIQTDNPTNGPTTVPTLITQIPTKMPAVITTKVVSSPTDGVDSKSIIIGIIFMGIVLINIGC